MSQWRIVVTDKRGKHLGVLGSYLAAKFSPRYNDIGAWSIAVPKYTKGWELISAGNCIVAYLDNVDVCGGPITIIDRHQNDSHPHPVYFVTGLTHEVHIRDHLGYLLPDQSGSAQSGLLNTGQTGNGDYALSVVIDENLGDGTAYGAVPHSSRLQSMKIKVPYIPFPGSGGAVDLVWKLDNLYDLCQRIAGLSGVGFKLVRNADNFNGGLTLYTWIPANRSATVQFSERRGNLGDNTLTVSAPIATSVIVGGSGDDTPITPRTLGWVRDSVAESLWGRVIETFSDLRDTADPAGLNNEANLILVDSRAGFTVSAQLFDGVLSDGSTTSKFNKDYFMGDTVRVIIDDQPIDDVVTQVDYNLDEDGATFTVVPFVGDWQNSSETLKIYRTVRDVARRIGLLERRV